LTSFRLPTSSEKAGYVLDQFDRIARRYDLTNDAISMGMHRLWKKRAVDELDCLPNGSYLDVCCGTGDLALRIAERLGPQGMVTGVDFSGGMLEVAKRREVGLAEMETKPISVQFQQRPRDKTENARQQGESGEGEAEARRFEWVQGDAQNLPFGNGEFDGAIISFGLRNLTDLQRGLDEMARVVKPGGRVLNLDVGHTTLPLFKQAFDLWFSAVVPVIGSVLQNDRKAYTYLPESAKAYPKPEEISRMFEQAGLKNVRHIPLALGSVALHVGTVA
jgi:demethylmenaquinone methyltransferase/2-methoxy-6-polyprenyl-1,4-benzoquinol methylase